MPSSLLDTIHAPSDLRRLNRAELGRLAVELRNFVLSTVSSFLKPRNFASARGMIC